MLSSVWDVKFHSWLRKAQFHTGNHYDDQRKDCTLDIDLQKTLEYLYNLRENDKVQPLFWDGIHSKQIEPLAEHSAQSPQYQALSVLAIYQYSL